VIVTGVSWITGCAAPSPPGEVADTVYTNGQIYTVDEARPWAEAVAIKDGKFLVVGSNADVEGVTGDATEVIDLDGAFVMPGLGDPHLHFGTIMPKRVNCPLPGTFYEPTEQEILDAVAACAANYPEGAEWFLGQGHSSTVMSDEALSRETLDRLVPDKPAWIEDESTHNGWFNTKAMELAGVTRDHVDNAEAFYSRTADGDLAGVAYEGGMNPFIEALPPFETEDLKKAYLALLDEASSKGYTSVGEAYTFEPDLAAWQELKQEGLNHHVQLYLRGNFGSSHLPPVESVIAWWEDYDLPGHPGVKLSMGGAIESVAEALVDGYADPDNHADPMVEAEAFANYVLALDEAGFQVMTHAIGDGSVRATIDGYETVIGQRGGNRLRHHIDHASLVHSDDFQRLVDLEIAASIWPPLNAPVAYNTEGIQPFLKPETWQRMYDNRARWDAGIIMHNHSDAPAAVLWPWFGMEATITRGFPGRPEVEKMGPQHALTLEETIRAHTLNVAWVMQNDDITGSIEEGKWADMIVLNHNLFEVPETEIHKTEVGKTIFKGEVVYEGN
jgi:hypothetical protein